jgi:hypothetical protein
MNPLRHPLYAFQTLSHKVLRRLLPFILITLLVASGLSAQPWARMLCVAQMLFYGSAAAGILARCAGRCPRALAVPVYFTTVNAAAFAAWFLLFRDFGVWSRVAREASPDGGHADANAGE